MKHKTLKKLLLISSTASAALLASINLNQPTQIYSENEGVQYIDNKEDKNEAPKVEEKTQEEINKEEGIAAEQIVVQINDDGYVTSHGDHYHYYNGKVPFDSILSDSLLVGDDYQFNESDVVNEIEDGYIIKQGDTYLVYLKDKSKAKNIRTQDEIVLQSYGVHPKDAHNEKRI